MLKIILSIIIQIIQNKIVELVPLNYLTPVYKLALVKPKGSKSVAF